MTGRSDHDRIELRWFSIRHTESIRIDSPIESILIDYSQLYSAVCKAHAALTLIGRSGARRTRTARREDLRKENPTGCRSRNLSPTPMDADRNAFIQPGLPI